MSRGSRLTADPARFADLQAHARVTAAAVRAVRAELAGGYQSVCFAPVGKRRNLERLERAERKASDRLFAYVHAISPRRWDSGIPAWHVRERLTFDDCVTRGELSVIPDPAYGYTEQSARAFAAALPEVPCER